MRPTGCSQTRPRPPIGGARDIRAALERAGRGGRLTPAELLEVGETLDATERFATRLKAWRGPHLSEVRDLLDPAPELAARIARSIDEGGEILDSASAELAAIRKRLRTAQDRVRERLNAMLRSSSMAGIIGEPIVTLRGGRYVIPIRAEAKGRVKGIVHDQSSSGATLFVEPLTVVELNNKWTEASLAAEREEERILDELSRAVEGRAPELRESLVGAGPSRPVAGPSSPGRRDGRRPAQRSPRTLPSCSRRATRCWATRRCPIDLRLGDRFGYRALVVTGPNTGGKTVSLKTLGLLSLMHQAGLRVPAADGARLPVFRRVMADIGDEQSIAQSLSTFSSHLRNVVRFVADAGPATLVLLDEVGAGTDPAEGSALAMAIVSRLLDAGVDGGGDDALRRAEGLRDGAPRGDQCRRRVRRGDAAADLSADHRAARQEPGLRDRRSARPSRTDPGRCAHEDLRRARLDGRDACRHRCRRASPGGCARGGQRRARRRPPRNASWREPGSRRRVARPPSSWPRRAAPPTSSWRARSGRSRTCAGR